MNKIKQKYSEVTEHLQRGFDAHFIMLGKQISHPNSQRFEVKHCISAHHDDMLFILFLIVILSSTPQIQI